MKPAVVSLGEAQLGLHFSSVEFVAFSPKQQQNKAFYFHGLQYVFLLFLSMASNTRVVIRRDHDIQKQVNLKLFWIGPICISSPSSIFPLWLSVQQLTVCVNPEKTVRARGNPGGN